MEHLHIYVRNIFKAKTKIGLGPILGWGLSLYLDNHPLPFFVVDSKASYSEVLQVNGLVPPYVKEFCEPQKVFKSKQMEKDMRKW